jgi:hypothetical protein
MTRGDMIFTSSLMKFALGLQKFDDDTTLIESLINFGKSGNWG